MRGVAGGVLGPVAAGRAADPVTVYAAHDQEFSEPILDRYTRETGVQVLAKYDVESTKTVGLVNLIRAEARRTRCDLFWNNEILNTLRLKQEGLLEPFRPEHGEEYPATARDGEGFWYGFAARARVLLVNTERVPAGERPAHLEQLVEGRWRGKFGLAKPLFGTTATHAACLYAKWGEKRATAFFEGLKANGVQILGGNRRVSQAVGAGQLAVGLTDTDDAELERVAGSPVEVVYLDRGAGELGTLFIPNTLAVIRGCRNARGAAEVAGYLLSPRVEGELARGPAAQIPLHPRTAVPARVETPRTVQAMEVDFGAAARAWDVTSAAMARIFGGA
jgi:iron(III) transport system substrate-binding protein